MDRDSNENDSRVSEGDKPAPTSDTADWAGEPAFVPGRAVERSLLLALLGSLTLHLAPFAAVLLGVMTLGGGESDTQHRLGDEAGRPDGINVEIINAEEYDRRYVSHTDGKGTGNEDAMPATAATASKATPTEVPPEKPKQPQSAPAEAPPTEVPPTEAPPTKAPPKPEVADALTSQEAEQLVRSAQSELTSIVDASSRASLAAQGSASPAMRTIMRKLKRAMPSSNVTQGFLVVRIVLSADGGVASVGVLQSSGKPELDKRVVASIRGALAPDPSTHLAPKERLLQITYEYF